MSSGSWNQGLGESSWNVPKREVTHGIPAHGEEVDGDKGAFWACTIQYKGQTYIGKCTDAEFGSELAAKNFT